MAVAHETGRIIYSNLTPDSSATAMQFSIANREHFLVHTRGLTPAAGLYISDPLQGRISGQWSIQFAQPLSRDGAFAGVLVVSVSPAFISEYFQKVFPNSGGDVALLLNDRGYYLARSSKQNEVIGSQVSEQW